MPRTARRRRAPPRPFPPCLRHRVGPRRRPRPQEEGGGGTAGGSAAHRHLPGTYMPPAGALRLRDGGGPLPYAYGVARGCDRGCHPVCRRPRHSRSRPAPSGPDRSGVTCSIWTGGGRPATTTCGSTADGMAAAPAWFLPEQDKPRPGAVTSPDDINEPEHQRSSTAPERDIRQPKHG